MGILEYIVTKIILPNLLKQLVTNGYSAVREHSKQIEIKEKITGFNKQFENTEIDCQSFQDFFDTTDTVSRIYAYIFNLNELKGYSEVDFIENLSCVTIDFVNKQKESLGHPKIKDITLVTSYFENLFKVLKEVRTNLQTTQDKAQTSIIMNGLNDIGEKVDKLLSQDDKLSRILSQLEATNNITSTNPLLKEKLDFIRGLIENIKFTEASNEIDKLLKNKFTPVELEEIYFLKGLLNLYNKNDKELRNLISNLEDLNPKSKYIFELNYRIACEENNLELFESAIKLLSVTGVDSNDITLKTAYFAIVQDDYEKVFELLTNNGEIMKEFELDEKANFYLGIAYLNKNIFDKATKYLKASVSIKPHPLYIYNKVVAEIIPILNNKVLLINQTAEKKAILGIALADLRGIEDYFNKVELIYRIQYWNNYLAILFVLDTKEVEKKYKELSPEIQDSIIIKGILAESYYIMKMYEESLGILDEIWRTNNSHLFKYLDVLRILGDWVKLKEVLRSISEDNYDDEGIIAIFSIESLLHDNDIEKAKVLINNYKERYYDSLYFIDCVLKMKDRIGEGEITQSFINQAVNIKGQLNEFEKLQLSRTFVQIEEYAYAKDLLHEIMNSDENALLMYLDILIFESTEESIDECKKIIESKCIEGNEGKAILKKKAKIEMREKEWDRALKTLEQINQHDEDYFIAFNALLCKYQLQQLDDIRTYTDILLKTNNLSAHILVARCYAEQGRWLLAKEIAFNALYKNGENIAKEDLFNYSSMYVGNIHQENAKEDAIEIVKAGNIVILKDEQGKYRRICIHTDPELIQNEGEYKFDCENYKNDSEISLIVLRSKAADKVTIDNIVYEITEIIDIYTYYCRYCWTKLDCEYENHGLYQKVRGESAEELVKEMTEMMKKYKKEREELIELYNFKKGIGLPVSFLANQDLSNYFDIILSILGMEHQAFYAGEVNLYYDEPMLLSLSTILLLQHFELITKVNKSSKKYYIAKSTLDFILKALKESMTKEQAIEGTSFVDDDGNLKFQMFSDEAKKNRVTFWKLLFSNIKIFNVIDKQVLQNELYDVSRRLINKIDIDSIEGAHQISGILVSDDLFIRKICKSVHSEIKTNNFLGFAFTECNLNFNEKLDLIHKLSKLDYIFCINEIILHDIITEYLRTDELNSDTVTESKVEEVISNINTDVTKNYYNEVFQLFIKLMESENDLLADLYKLMEKPLKLKPYDEYLTEFIESIHY